MKRILSIALIGTIMATSAFAGDIVYLGQKEKTIQLQVKSIDISDSGLDSGVIYGLGYTIHKDIGDAGAWGLKFGFEFNYGKLDYKNTSGDTTYTEASFTLAPTYTFSCNARAYAGVKAGYVGFSDNIGSNNGTNGYVLAGIVGAEYPLMKHLVVGAQTEFGNTYVESESYSTTVFSGFIGYKF